MCVLCVTAAVCAEFKVLVRSSNNNYVIIAIGHIVRAVMRDSERKINKYMINYVITYARAHIRCDTVKP